MTTVSDSPAMSGTSSSDFTDELDYKAISRSAVVSLVFGIIGLLSWEFPYLILLPLLGFLCGLFALQMISKYRDELTGRSLAWTGVILGGALTLISPIRHTIIYLTEVPEGFERVHFSVLKSPTGAPDFPTKAAADLDGKQIFIKGYIHPTSLSSKNSKSFILVPDWATCCFGTQPPLTHMVEVRLINDKFASKSFRQHSLAGRFTLIPGGKPVEGFTGVYYQLEAEHFQ
jgi:hypothetical protein